MKENKVATSFRFKKETIEVLKKLFFVYRKNGMYRLSKTDIIETLIFYAYHKKNKIMYKGKEYPIKNRQTVTFRFRKETFIFLDNILEMAKKNCEHKLSKTIIIEYLIFYALNVNPKKFNKLLIKYFNKY